MVAGAPNAQGVPQLARRTTLRAEQGLLSRSDFNNLQRLISLNVSVISFDQRIAN